MAAKTAQEAGTKTEIDVVREFLAALEANDLDRALGLLDADVVYQNVPFPAARGLAAVSKQLRLLDRPSMGFAVEHHNIAASGATVLTERTDIIKVGAVEAAFWVCGTFEVHDGRITLWRDRFDFIDFTGSFVRGGVQALLGAARGLRR